MYFFAAEQWDSIFNAKKDDEGRKTNERLWLMLAIAHKSRWCFPQVKKDNISV